jgi:hypothetical protein
MYIRQSILNLLPNPKLVPRRDSRTIQIRLVCVRVAVEGGIDRPLDETEGGVEAWRESVADGAVKVVTENEVVSVDGLFEGDGEGDGVLVFFVEGMVEVGVRVRGVVGEAYRMIVSYCLMLGYGLKSSEGLPV